MAPRIIQAITVDEPDRPIISITSGGRPTNYEIAVKGDFGIRQITQLERLKRKIDSANLQDDEITEADAETVASALDTFVRMVIRDCPDEVFGKLTDGHKMLVLEAFIAESDLTPEPTPLNRAASRRTSTRSSPRSSASTAAPRKAG